MISGQRIIIDNSLLTYMSRQILVHFCPQLHGAVTRQFKGDGTYVSDDIVDPPRIVITGGRASFQTSLSTAYT